MILIFSTFLFQIRFLNKTFQLWITVLQTGNPTQHFLSSLRRKLEPTTHIHEWNFYNFSPFKKSFCCAFPFLLFAALKIQIFFITGRGSFYGVRTQFISPPFPFWGGNGIHIHLELRNERKITILSIFSMHRKYSG